MLLCGPISVIVTKFIDDTQVIGIDGRKHYFSKAFFQLFLLYTGISLCYPVRQVSDLFRVILRKPDTYSKRKLQRKSKDKKVAQRSDFYQRVLVCSLLFKF